MVNFKLSVFYPRSPSVTVRPQYLLHSVLCSEQRIFRLTGPMSPHEINLHVKCKMQMTRRAQSLKWIAHRALLSCLLTGSHPSDTGDASSTDYITDRTCPQVLQPSQLLLSLLPYWVNSQQYLKSLTSFNGSVHTDAKRMRKAMSVKNNFWIFEKHLYWNMKMVFVFNSLFEFVRVWVRFRQMWIYLKICTLIIPSLPQASKLTNCYSDHLPMIIYVLFMCANHQLTAPPWYLSCRGRRVGWFNTIRVQCEQIKTNQYVTSTIDLLWY